MKNPTEQHPTNQRSGFAIVVVLSSLLILTTLFAIASQRSMAHIQTQSVERHLAQQQLENRDILTMLARMDPTEISLKVITMPSPYDTVNIRLQDVGGLIDLNTAAPELLVRMFDALGFPEGAAETFRAWRREGRRLHRVDDLIRITNADNRLLDELLVVATVHSGRRGIAKSVAPLAVTQIALANQETAPSLVNYAAYRENNAGEELIGVVSMSASLNQARVLELR